MKKITLLLAFMLAFVTQGYSQVGGYAFSQSTEAYTAVAGITSTAAGDDGIQNGIPIGFTFKYDGVDYSHFCVTTNGWIKMGNATTTGNTGTANYSNAFSVTAGNRPLIAPFWDDNHLGTGNIQYVVSGTAPNRTLEVGWDSVNIGGIGATSATAFASFKLRLYETTNVIDFVYGPVMDAAGTLTASVGLNGSSSFLSVTPAPASTVSSGTANNAISATTNLVGKKYTFTPPTCSSPGGTTVSAVTTTTATISWTAVVPTPATGYEYVVSTSNTTPVVSGTATTAISVPVTGLLPATTYYVFVRSNCGSGFGAWSSSFAFTTPCNPYSIPYFEGFESGYTNNTNVLGCLSQESVAGTPAWTANSSLTTYNRSPRTGSWNAFLQYGNEDWIFIPVNLIGGTSYTTSLFARQDGVVATNSEIAISYGTAGNAASMINTIVADTGIINGNYQQIAGSFTPVTSGTYYVGIKGRMNFNPFYISLDDISIYVTPACVNPLGLAASAVTNNSATITWTVTTGNYEYVLDNTAADPSGSGATLAGETYNATLLAASTTYYFHVRTVCAGPTYSTWSTVSFTTPAAPPVNDSCSTPIVLTPGTVFTDQDIDATNLGATLSVESPSPSCGTTGFATSGKDVWYSVVVPPSGNITIETDVTSVGTGLLLDTVTSIYSGTCGALTEVDCDDSSGNSTTPVGADYSMVSLTGQNPGDVLLIRAYGWNGAQGNFSISAYDASLSIASFDTIGFSAYPNPVKDILNLSYTKEISNVSVHNLLGQEVMTKSINAAQTKIDMSNLSNGTYLVKVTVDGLVKTLKVVKQ